MKITLLYSQPHSGHAQAARALAAQWKKTAPQIQTQEMDWITRIYPVLGPWVAKAYLEMLKRTPALWDYLYDNKQVAEVTGEIRRLFHCLDAAKVHSILEETSPDAVVCTHALPCSTLALEKAQGKFHRPLVAVITDFMPHLYWIHEGVDLYLAPNEESSQELIRMGIPEERIRITGIPIQPSFRETLPKETARERLGLRPDRFTLLIVGGGHGIGPIQGILEALQNSDISCQTIVVTGRNEKLREELSGRPTILLGYADNMPLLMSAADVLIGKAGGLTCSEALSKKLPMLLVQPLPGQEENNSRYLVKQNAAMRLNHLRELTQALRSLAAQPEKLRRMGENAGRIARSDSQELACNAILNLCSMVRRQKNVV